MAININRISILKKQLENKYKANENPYYISYNVREGAVVSIVYKRKGTDKIKSYTEATEGFKEAYLYLSSLSFYKEHTEAARDYLAVYDNRTGILNIMTEEEVMM